MPGPRILRPPALGVPYFRDLLSVSVLAGIVGALTGLVAVGVRLAIAFVTGVAFRGDVEWIFRSPVEGSRGYWLIIVPAVGALLAYIIVRVLSSEDRIRGSSEIVRSVAMRRGQVSRRKLVGHALATIVSVGTGGSAGREGAMVQLGAALGMLAARLRGASIRHRKLLLAAGSGAAISATFNTPIAGVIFAMEVILLEWSTRAFVPLVVASAMGSLVATQFLGDQPTFPIPAYELVSSRELVLYVMLGVLAGLVAVALSRLLRFSDGLFEALPGPQWTKHLWGGLLLGGIGLLAPQVLGVGYETVELTLSGKFVVTLLAGVLAAKVFAYAVTRGSSGASGAFSPTFFIGSALGGIFGALVHFWFPSWTGGAGGYALVGMVTVYAAVTRASLTAIVMLYEMTHTFSSVIPVMLAVVVADALSKSFGAPAYFRGGSGGPSLEADASANVLDLASAGDVMTKQVDTVREDEPVRNVVNMRMTTGHQGFPVVSNEGALLGIITPTDLRKKVKDGDLDKPVAQFMTPDPVCVTPSVTVHEALSEMVRLGVGHMPVVDERNPSKLVGILTRSDVLLIEKRALEEDDPTESELERPLAFWRRVPWRRHQKKDHD